LWLHSLKVAQLLRSAACLHTNQSRSYLNHLVHQVQVQYVGDVTNSVFCCGIPADETRVLIYTVHCKFLNGHF